MSQNDVPTVYVDESSNSGENLLDPEQPAYAVAAVHLGHAEAEEVVAGVKSQLPQQLREPKYGVLARSAAGRRTLLEALSQLPSDTAYTVAVNKRYMIIAKMVDLLTVELAHEDGYDMYADGSAVGLANLMYLVGPVVGDPAAFDEMLRTFVNATRMRQKASVDQLFVAIEAYRDTVSGSFRDHIRVFEYARHHAEDLVALVKSGTIRDNLDPALTCLITLCYEVGDQIGDFHLLHDQSKTIAHHVATLLTLDQLPAITPGLPPRKLPVASISFGDSLTSSPLQIADWVAGATRQVAQATTTGIHDEFAEQLRPIASPWVVETIFPNPELITNPRRL